MTTYAGLSAQRFTGVVLIYGDNCAPCARLKPRLQAVCSELGIELVETAAAVNMDAVRFLGIRGVPAVVVMKEGADVATHVGESTDQFLREIFTNQGLAK